MKSIIKILCALIVLSSTSVYSQSKDTVLRITSPFDSLVISSVNAKGNRKTGQINVSINIKNNYVKEAELVLSLSAFGDFGVTDVNGVKYKPLTRDYMGNLSAEDKSYKPITSLSFGNNRSTMIGSMVQNLKGGESETFAFSVKNSIDLIKELHVLCTLSLNGMFVDSKQFKVENLKVNWSPN